MNFRVKGSIGVRGKVSSWRIVEKRRARIGGGRTKAGAGAPHPMLKRKMRRWKSYQGRSGGALSRATL